MQDKKYWVGFNHVKGIGAVRIKGLLDYFGDLSIAWEAPPSALMSAGLNNKTVENFLVFKKNAILDQLYENIIRQGINIITLEDDIYPRKLKEIEQPPPVIYIRGNFSIEDEWSVAIVGTRRMSAYGKRVTEELASYLAKNNISVVSGLARGIDTVAHESANREGGRSLAVMGCGVDIIYPPENRKLAEKLTQNGGLISDYAPGTPPDGVNFPPRNRIISGLSLATVVIEAGEKSGALITANFAVNQGREVFAVPGNIYSLECKGTNALIRDGARPLINPQDVLEVLHLQQIQEHRALSMAVPPDKLEYGLLQILSSDPLHVDEVSLQSGLPIQKVSATLAMMELKGMVMQLGGMSYIRLREPKKGYRVNNHE